MEQTKEWVEADVSVGEQQDGAAVRQRVHLSREALLCVQVQRGVNSWEDQHRARGGYDSGCDKSSTSQHSELAELAAQEERRRIFEGGFLVGEQDIDNSFFDCDCVLGYCGVCGVVELQVRDWDSGGLVEHGGDHEGFRDDTRKVQVKK